MTKIVEIGLSKLNNAEYTNFMSRVYTEVQTATIKKLGINQEILDSLKVNITKLNDLVAQSRISDSTAKLSELDNERGNILIYIMAEIDTKKRSPLGPMKEVATSLYNSIHQYRGIQKDPVQQETQKIKGLLLDLAKPENALNATTLGLDAAIEQLRSVNDAYETLTVERAHKKTESYLDNSKVVRAENDAVYDTIATMAFVTSVAKPSLEASTFVTSLNALIVEIKTLYNQRRASSKASIVR